jgi:two-component system sensor histidine kinase KdpD
MPGAQRGHSDTDAYRVVIEVGDRRLGSIWAVRPRASGAPDGTETRLLSAAADQIGQALEQDRLGREAREVEIARRSDALKTALLESVSHDLRTPLTSIRAAAGTLLDRDVPLDQATQEATAEAIDREAEHLNRLVTNLLDLSRIEAGELRADAEPFELSTLVGRAADRLRPRLAGRSIEIDVPDDLPPVLVDEVFIDQALTNLLENAIKYTGPAARIRIHASRGSDAPAVAGRGSDAPAAAGGGPEAPAGASRTILLTLEDDGPGVPDDAIERLFDRFFRIRRRGEPSRPGSGIGLTVVRGLVEAMGGRVRASRSSLGGLAIELTLPSVAPLAGGGG